MKIRYVILTALSILLICCCTACTVALPSIQKIPNILDPIIDPPEVPEVVVPSLLHLRFSDVESNQYTDYQDFTIRKTGEQPSEVFEAGEIMYQNPIAGSTVKPGTIIEVIVCSGRAMVEVQNYVNKPYDQVYNDLKALGLNPDLEYIPDDELVRGQVIRTDPPYGVQTPAGSTVKVYVSTGRATKYVTVPDFVGIPAGGLMREAEKSGLTLGDVEEVFSETEAGRVVWQSIPEGAEVAEKTKISFRVSKGPAQYE